MTPEEAAWSAGLFDGEGCISIGTQGEGGWTVVRLHLGMTDEDVVRRFHRTMGFGSVSIPKSRSKTRKTMYRWQGGVTLDRLPSLEAAWKPWLGKRRIARLQEARQALESAAARPRAAWGSITPAGTASARAAARSARRAVSRRRST